jgi:DNA-binding response OmpR family regulator
MRIDRMRYISSIATTSLDVSYGASVTPVSNASNCPGTNNPKLIGPATARVRAAVGPMETTDRPVRLEGLPQTQAETRETVLQVGPLELDLIERTAERAGRTIDLLPKEFCLLKFMMQHSDQLLKRCTLLKEVWHCRFILKTNRVDVHMGRLRHKIDGPYETPMIHSVRGAGFILRTPF